MALELPNYYDDAASGSDRTPTTSNLLESSRAWNEANANAERPRITTDGSAKVGNIDLAETSKACLGQQLWQEHASATSEGRLGAAAAVSKVLQIAHCDQGMKDFAQLSIKGLDDGLASKGWSAHETPKPGDVVVGYYNGAPYRGGNAGIVGADCRTVMLNSSSTGRWTEMPISTFINNRDMEKVLFRRAPEEMHSLEIPALPK